MLDAELLHDDVIDRLRCLVQACHEAAVSGHDLAERYMAVRADAAALNQQYGWATSEEFAAQVPSIESLLETEALDRAFGATATPGLPVERGGRRSRGGGPRRPAPRPHR